ncbi:hypothetical protein [Sphingosinicella sp. CPCC 101087]|uniref:hypothetical protein n=1 Tax=Sphingosinicella sp. CPCC 101087 TaxID=2497754 RepID=UPI0013EB7AE1|nr:hypothetical protein [Sphingosinicella sp. CPCC 101087]
MKSVLLCAASIAVAVAAGAGAQSRPAGGTATYWMSAETMSGFAAGAAQANPQSVVGALLGGRGGGANPSFVRNLHLQLGSPRRANGAPSAEHLPPAGLGAGPSLPLTTPQAAPQTTPPNYMPGMTDGNMRGRLLIYWGCGEQARSGQPVEIDFARMARGEVPAAMAALNLQPMMPPSPATSATYGEWPNERGRTTVPATGSLVGDHVVRGNYSPEIRFALAQGQDFLAPVNVTSNSPAASGSVPVTWQAVPNARAYFVMATGAREDGTIVMWTSSEVQAAQMAFDYLSQGDIDRLLQQRVLLNPQTTQCTVPAEVAGSVQAASLMVNAFGPEANFSHPARPANAPRNWAPEWAVKLRTRSTYMGMLGMDMAAMMGGNRNARSGEEPSRPERRRRRNPLERIFGQ